MKEDKYPGKYIRKGLTLLAEIPDLPRDIFVFLVIILAAFGGFLALRIWQEGEGNAAKMKIIAHSERFVELYGKAGSSDPSLVSSQGEASAVKGVYVGSISGTTYHLPSCSGAKRIKEENKIWFTTKNEAEGMGYKPAKNCKGM